MLVKSQKKEMERFCGGQECELCGRIGIFYSIANFAPCHVLLWMRGFRDTEDLFQIKSDLIAFD